MITTDILVLGSITIDHINNSLKIGGPAFYTFMASKLANTNTFLLGTAGHDLPDGLLDSFNGIFVLYKKAIRFKHVYVNQRDRISYLLVPPAYPVDVYISSLLQFLKPKAIILNPVYHEFSLSMLKRLINYCKSKKILIAIDMQGFLRKTKENTKISLMNIPPHYRQIVLEADIVKMTAEESIHINISINKKIVLITRGKNGSELISEETHILAPTLQLSGDPTGAGDAFLLGFVSAYLQRNNLKRSLAFAQALATMFIGSKIISRDLKSGAYESIKRITKSSYILRDEINKRTSKIEKMLQVLS